VRGLIEQHLHVLVEQIGARPPGSPANRRATTYVHDVLSGCGLDVVEYPFETCWWEPGRGWLGSAAGRIEVDANPYSPAGDIRGHAVHVEEVSQLEELGSARGDVLIMSGELTREPVMPAAFPFVDLPEHTRIRAALRRLGPAAVIAVSDHGEPILEDPELSFPSTTVPSRILTRLREGEPVRLVLGGAVQAGEGATVSARTGDGHRRLVLSAHLDSKATTPGAFDNAASVATILALAETGLPAVGPLEIVMFNGEDHFDACGEVAWLAGTELAEVTANLNVDGAGLAGQGTSLATLACPEPLAARLAAWADQRPGWTNADPWVESDHALFAMHGIPAAAVTSQDVHQLLGGLAHTPADTLDVLDLAVLEDLAAALPELLTLLAGERLDRRTAASDTVVPPAGAT